MNHRDNYEYMKEKMQRQFLEYDQEGMIGKFGLRHDAQYLYLECLERAYRISRTTGVVEWTVGHGLLSPFRMRVATSFYQRPASRVYFIAFFNLRNLLYLIRVYFFAFYNLRNLLYLIFPHDRMSCANKQISRTELPSGRSVCAGNDWSHKILYCGTLLKRPF